MAQFDNPLLRAIQAVETPSPEDVARFQSFRPTPFGQELLGPEFRTPAPFDPFGGLPQADPEGIQTVLTALLTGGTAGALGTMRAAAGAPGSTAGAFFGGGKRRPLFHGRGRESSIEEILSKGFTKTKSSELELPGASLTTDPTVAAGFAGASTTGASPAFNRILAIELGLDPSQIANLDPETFLLGGTRGAVATKKPTEFFREAETFLVRHDPFRLENVKQAIREDSAFQIPGSAVKSLVDAPTTPRAFPRRLTEKEQGRVRRELLNNTEAYRALGEMRGLQFSGLAPPEAFVIFNKLSSRTKALRGLRGARSRFIDDMAEEFVNPEQGRPRGPLTTMVKLGDAIGDEGLSRKAKRVESHSRHLKNNLEKISAKRNEISGIPRQEVRMRTKAAEGVNDLVRETQKLRNQLEAALEDLAGHTLSPTKEIKPFSTPPPVGMAEEILGGLPAKAKLTEALSGKPTIVWEGDILEFDDITDAKAFALDQLTDLMEPTPEGAKMFKEIQQAKTGKEITKVLDKLSGQGNL